jgi:uncharacterized ion transporter superfamily protein YfcC
MELITFLAIALIVGLIIRKKDDNTMQTLSKGCGCIVVFIIIAMILIFYYGIVLLPKTT